MGEHLSSRNVLVQFSVFKINIVVLFISLQPIHITAIMAS